MPFLAPLLAAASTAFAGLGAAAGGAGIFGSFLTFLKGGSLLAGIVKAGFAMAAQYALGALFAPKPTASSSQLQAVYGESVPRSVVLGRCGVSGQHVFRSARSKGNRTIDDVYAVSNFRISNLARILVDGKWRTVEDTNDEVPGDKGNIHVRWREGTMDQTVLSYLVDNTRWRSTSVGAGIAYAVVTSELDIEERTTPIEPIFEIYGPYLYDWRLDDTVGGDGDNRWNDQDTWSGPRENPVLQMYLLERGVYNGTELIVGKGVPASRLPLAEWTIAANICDETVSAAARYRSSIIAGAGEGITHDSNMQPLLESCAASWIEDATGEYPIVGAVQAVVATFTDDDLIVGEAYRFSKYRKRLELVNTVASSYVDPAAFYEDTSLATRIDEDALATDGERLAVALPFKAVNYSGQADRLADIQIRASRYQANAEICLRPKFLQLKPGRWVTWDSAKHGERTFLILSKRLGAIGSNSVRNVYLTLQEIGDGVFDPTAYTSVPTAPLPPGTPDYQSELDNYALAPFILTSEATGQLPAIRASWDAILDTTITGVEFEYWPTAEPETVLTDFATKDLTVKYLTNGIISSTEYQIRYRLRANPPRSIPWVGPEAITSPAAAGTDLLVKFANLSDSLKASLQSTAAQLQLQTFKLQQLAAAANDLAGKSVKNESAAVKYQNAIASAIQEINASIEEVDGELTAQAEAITALQATVGDSGAGALFRMFVSAGSGEIISRIELQVRATVDGDWVSAGTIWEAGIDGDDDPYGRILMAAQQIVILDGNDDVQALFDETGVSIATALIRDLTATNITARTITGDRIVTLGIDTPELQIDSVTYIDSATTATDVNIEGGSNPTTPRLTVMVDDYVSGGVLGTANLQADMEPGPFTSQNYIFMVKRDSSSAFNVSPVVVGAFPIVAAEAFGTYDKVSIAFADIPPSAGDWYYAIFAGSTLGGSNALKNQTIVVAHAKR